MLTTHVVSQSLAAELKEAGWPQEGSTFYWNTWGNKFGNPFITASKGGLVEDMTPYLAASPLASELLERMPVSVSIENDERTNKLMVMKLESTWLCQYEFLDSDGDGWGVYADASLPDAIAKLALHLLKENKLNLE